MLRETMLFSTDERWFSLHVSCWGFLSVLQALTWRKMRQLSGLLQARSFMLYIEIYYNEIRRKGAQKINKTFLDRKIKLRLIAEFIEFSDKTHFSPNNLTVRYLFMCCFVWKIWIQRHKSIVAHVKGKIQRHRIFSFSNFFLNFLYELHKFQCLFD